MSDSEDSDSVPLNLNARTRTERNSRQDPNEPKTDDFRRGQIDDAQLKLLRSGENSDLEIRCRERTWAVQKAILAQRCPFFAGAMRWGFQEQSSGIIVMDEDEPQAIDELLTYLYTLSDHINVLPIHGRRLRYIDPAIKVSRFIDADEKIRDRPQQLQTLANDVKHLSDVLVTADKYQVSDLATLAGQKIEKRLLAFVHWASRLEDMHARLTSAFSEALYFEHEIPPLQEYQDTFLTTIIHNFDIVTAFDDIEFIQAHPRLTREVLRDRNKALKSERQMRDEMVEDVPKSKRKKYTMQR
ncbi:hypothetical protein EPUS_05170 [Endocarpon pusillum Z07020]|uniref:BTB domain-containing protein n=1 Tax=Endocarpon pusillum (strain Z07020 / HMAS-L-300199) TaxID=1263415 RepID=U1GBM8_ENDPU|nr:uncharacterized protein EPUS_05170 [Endocarpon pusillum Z07020]ERF74962.1 hypothetical protein EPUS_05170 [Endocarpon pusillum Z07020]